MKNYDLGTEKIGRLVRHFSVPCVISMLVAALYNIVDQIFIGWSSAGAFGNAATNIVYPFTVLALGLSLLVGDGAAANFSLESGKKNKDRADKSVGNGFLLLIIFSFLLCLMGFIFKSQILKLFGANPKEKVCYDFAIQYFTVICAGLPFYMIGQGMNASIRADDSPKYAMACTLAGAIANLTLSWQKQKNLHKNFLLGQMSSFKFLFFGWLFASQKTGFSGFRYRFIPSLRFGTGYASPYNPC
ncbi:MAG: MATE family efflux transporter, partial [Treponema sp.]|nr:MATE family efflux transporter [Treponema sp.]